MKRQKLTRRDFLRASALGVAGSVLVACAPQQTAAPTTAPVAASPTNPPAVAPTTPPAATPTTPPTAVVPTPQPPTINPAKVAWWQDSGVPATCTDTNVVKPFNAKFQDMLVEIDQKASVRDALRPALAANQGPDIIATDGPGFVPPFADDNLVLPLDVYSAQYNWDALFQDWSLAVSKYKGKLFSLPTELETLVLYYNKTLFDKNGWTAPKTVDEWVSLCAKVEAAGLIPMSSGVPCNSCSDWLWTAFVNGVAGPQKVYDALKGNIPWTDAAFVNAIGILKAMMDKGYWNGGSDKYLANTDYAQLGALFVSGKAAMRMEGTWAAQATADDFKKAGLDWDWVPVPSSTGEAIFPMALGGTLSINAAAKSPEATAKFLNYLFQPETQGILWSKCGIGMTALKNPPIVAEMDAKVVRIWQEVGKSSTNGNNGYAAWAFLPPATETVLWEDFQKLFVGDITTEQYLADFDKQFQVDLKAGTVPPVPPR